MIRRVQKVFEFDAAHRLMGYEGLCSNVHGHRYKAEVVCSCDDLDGQDMVVDFGVLKRHVKRWIDAWWDHAIILNRTDPLCRALVDKDPEIPGLPEMRVYGMESNPTAEAMAEELWDRVDSRLSNEGVTLDMVKIYETPTSVATYSR